MNYTKQELLDQFLKSAYPIEIPIFSELLEVLPELFSHESVPPSLHQGTPHPVDNMEEMLYSQEKVGKKKRAMHRNQKFVKSPFLKSGLVLDGDEQSPVWFYLDEGKTTQGPFTTVQMDHWYNKKQFLNTLPIKLLSMSSFKNLDELLLKKVTDGPPPGQFTRAQSDQ